MPEDQLVRKVSVCFCYFSIVKGNYSFRFKRLTENWKFSLLISLQGYYRDAST